MAQPSTAHEHHTAIIELHRSSARRDRLRQYVVNIDGRKVGAIGAGETREFRVNPGAHTVRLRLDWPWRSRTLHIDSRPASRTLLDCQPSFGLGILAATVGFLRYIDLVRHDDDATKPEP